MRYKDKNEIMDNMLKISTSIRDRLSQEQKHVDSISYYINFFANLFVSIMEVSLNIIKTPVVINPPITKPLTNFIFYHIPFIYF